MGKKKKLLLAFIPLCVILVAGIIFSLWRPSSSQFDGAYEGMPIKEFYELIPEDQYLSYLGYIFYKHSDGTDVVATVSDDYKSISSLRTFPDSAGRPGRRAAHTIVPGMTVYDVVRILGTPKGTYTSGMISLYFELNDGGLCVVYFNNSSEMLTTSVHFPE